VDSIGGRPKKENLLHSLSQGRKRRFSDQQRRRLSFGVLTKESSHQEARKTLESLGFNWVLLFLSL
jgi:hypothetical protein